VSIVDTICVVPIVDTSVSICVVSIVDTICVVSVVDTSVSICVVSIVDTSVSICVVSIVDTICHTLPKVSQRVAHCNVRWYIGNSAAASHITITHCNALHIAMCYGLASFSRHLKIIGLFCKRDL